jgi:cysteine synthase A
MLKMDTLFLRSLMGKTPVYEFRPHAEGASVLVKLEGSNIGGSVKDRAAWGMLRLAEKEGRLSGQTTIVEPTSGNTGISLAMFGAALGIPVILTMPASMSEERQKILQAYGARIVLTDAKEGMTGAVKAARAISEETPGSYMPDQFSNPGNPWAHAVTTGPELLQDLGGREPFAFVAGIGTGGTLSGTAKTLKSVFPAISVIGLEPSKSPVLSGGQPGAHGIQGIGAGFVPDNLNREVVDRIIPVEDEAAFEAARGLAKRHGLFCGISTGANVWGAIELARSAPQDSVVMTVACDRGDKYLSTALFSTKRE